MDIIKTLAEELQIGRHQAEAAVKLIDEGNTIPFIARYRKDCLLYTSDILLGAERNEHFCVGSKEMFQLADLLFNGSFQAWSYLDVSSCNGITHKINSFF